MGTLGAAAMATLLTAVVLLTVHVPLATVATDHIVGGSMWSIPLRDDLYMAWSNNRTFYAGDNLGEHWLLHWLPSAESMVLMIQ